MVCARTVLVALCLLLTVVTASADAATERDQDRPKVGLVLGGGGTKAGAHIGVLRVLESLNVPIDYIAGTSAGAIIGGLYAAGLSADEIEAAIAQIDWNDMLRDAPPRRDLPFRRKLDDESYLVKSRPGFRDGRFKLPMGLNEGQKITQFLRRQIVQVANVEQFDDLPIPIRIATTDLATGKTVVLSEGDLALAMRASMSIPVLFSPVTVSGRTLVDGSVSNNLPIDLVRQMGADIVIAVDITGALLGQDALQSVLSVTDQLTNLLVRQNVDRQLQSLDSSDILIQPDLNGIEPLDFEKTLAAVSPGEQAAQAQRARLQRLSASPAVEAAIQRARMRDPVSANASIAFIEVLNSSAISTNTIRRSLGFRVGDPIDLGRIERGIARVYGLDLFQRIDYRIVHREAATGVLIDVVPKPWGPDYLQFGLQLSEDFATGADFNLGIAYLRTAVNELGGEWRAQLDLGERQGLSFDWFQPLSLASRYFVELGTEVGQRTFRVFSDSLNDSAALADVRIRSFGGSLSAGLELGVSGELRAGWVRATGELEPTVGSLDVVDERVDVGELFVGARYDRLDNANFPRTGASAAARFSWSQEAAGADQNFRQAVAGYYRADSFGEYTLFSGMEGGLTLGEDAPVQSQFLLGGLGRLSGYATGRLLGQHYGLASVAAYKRLRRSQWLPVYAGLTLEMGNVWDDRSDIGFADARLAGSLFGGVDTPAGPLYLAWGLGQGGEHTFYLHLGSPFVGRALRPQD